MAFDYFCHNDELLPSEKAVVPLSDVAYSYGYGVYETIRYANGKIYFLKEHLARLAESAQIIGLEHTYDSNLIGTSLKMLIAKNKADACNIKILLIGGRNAEDANLYIICLNPLFPDRKLYQHGAHAITYKYEREFPHAKTLNMLPSYLAYREATKSDAYDALLINRHGNIVEGTRTNFFAMSGKTIYSPQEDEILLGVTREKVLDVARSIGYKIVIKDLPLKEIQTYDNVFITSTSSKIMPLRSIDGYTWDAPGQNLLIVMKAFGDWLSSIK